MKIIKLFASEEVIAEPGTVVIRMFINPDGSISQEIVHPEGDVASHKNPEALNAAQSILSKQIPGFEGLEIEMSDIDRTQQHIDALKGGKPKPKVTSPTQIENEELPATTGVKPTSKPIQKQKNLGWGA